MVKTGEIKDNMFDLYALYNQHVRLFNFYKARKKMKSEEEILQRIKYISENKIRQRNEIESLLWVLGKSDLNEDTYY